MNDSTDDLTSIRSDKTPEMTYSEFRRRSSVELCDIKVLNFKDQVARMSTSKYTRGYFPKIKKLTSNTDAQILISLDTEEDISIEESQQSFLESTPGSPAKEQSDDDITILTLREPQPENAIPMEVIDYIEIFEEDDLDGNYKNIRVSEMKCEVCERQFKNRHQFTLHHRRHIAYELFQCPTCLTGFVSLRLCAQHEIRVHKKKLIGIGLRDGYENSDSGFERESCSTISSAASFISNSTYEEDEEDDTNFSAGDGSKRILTSNSLISYRGPPVEHMTQCFDVELKSQLKNRGGFSSVSNQIQAIRERFLIIGDNS